MIKKSNSLTVKADVRQIASQWSERANKLQRHRVQLPDLTDVINPKHEHSKHIINRMHRFDSNRGGLTANSVKALCSALKKWKQFCSVQELYAFPLDDHIYFELFLKGMVLDDYSIATIKQTRAMISSFYTYLKIDNPANTPDIKSFIKSLVEDFIDLKGDAYRQSQATPLRRTDLNNLYTLNDTDPISPKFLANLRDIAFLSVAYATCLRVTEISNIKVKHIAKQSNGKVKISRTRSKTSTSVKAKYLESEQAERLLMYYEKVSPYLKQDDYLFTWVTSAYNVPNGQKPLTKSNSIGIFKKQYARLAKSRFGVSYNSPWSGHSARVGRVIDGKVIDDLTDWGLMQLGEWTSMKMVSVYLRNWMEYEFDADSQQ